MPTYELTVDHTKVADTLTGFPVYVDLAGIDPVMSQADADSIRVFKSDGMTEVPREVVSTGELWFLADLSDAVDTVYLIDVDGQRADYLPGDPCGANAVWTAYEAVWHLAPGAVTVDSTGNGWTLTDLGHTAQAGKFTGGIEPAGNDTGLRAASYVVDRDPDVPISLSAWVKWDGTDKAFGVAVNSDGFGQGPALLVQASDWAWWYRQNTGGMVSATRDVWTHLVGTMDGAATGTQFFYVDGALEDSRARATSEPLDAPARGPLRIGSTAKSQFSDNRYFPGVISEVRAVDGGILSAEWIATEYANQSNPSTFYTVAESDSQIVLDRPVSLTTSGLHGRVVRPYFYDAPGMVELSGLHGAVHVARPVTITDTPAEVGLSGLHGKAQRPGEIGDDPARLTLSGLHGVLSVGHITTIVDIPAEVTLTGLHATAGVETRPLWSQPPMSGPGWVGKVVDMDGGVYATLPRINVKSWVRELNQPDEVTVEIPKHDPAASAVQVLGRELQLFFDGDLKAWVVPLNRRRSSADAAVRLTGLGPDWYLHKRFLGGPELPNRISNGGFEAGLSRWTAFNTSATVVTSPTLLGGHAVRLVSSGDGGMLAQAINWDAGQNANLMYASGWFYLESLPGERVDTPGLTIRAWTASGGTWEGASRITDRTELRTWTRVEVRCKVPAGLSTVQVEAHGPNGSIVWDDIRVFLSDALAPDGGPANPATWGTDIAGMAFRTVKLAQAQAHGKSDVNIGVDAEPTGTVTRRGWPLRTHPQVTAVLKELRETGSGMEHRMRFTPTTRTFVARKTLGVDRSGTLTLRSGSVAQGGNLASWTVNEDATAVVTSAVAQGNYPGWTKQEQSWSDASKLGGLVLDAVVQADDGVLPDKLAGVAKEYVEEHNTVDVDVTVQTHDGDAALFHTLGIGDRVNLDVGDGDIHIYGRHRIVKIVAEPKTLSLTLDLVRY